MTIAQHLSGNKGRVFQWTDTEHEIDALYNVIHIAISNQHLHTDFRVGRLEPGYQWCEQAIRNAGGRRQPQRALYLRQLVRDHAIHSFADFQTFSSVFKYVNPNFGQAKLPCRTLKQPNTELVFQLSHFAAYG